MPKLTKPGFGGFGNMPPAYFWQPVPETPRQLDAVDAPDAGDIPQGLETHDLRRPRQLRRLDWEFLTPGA